MEAERRSNGNHKARSGNHTVFLLLKVDNFNETGVEPKRATRGQCRTAHVQPQQTCRWEHMSIQHLVRMSSDLFLDFITRLEFQLE